MSRKRKQYPSQARLRELFDYDPVSGDITKKGTGENAIRYDYKAKGGYKRGRVVVDGSRMMAARAAYIHQHGDIPDNKRVVISDGDPMNLCLSNLQLTSYGQTGASGFYNHPDRKIKYKGVCFVNGRYQARIRINNRTKSLGCYGTPEEAASAYNEAALAAFGVHAHLNDIPDPLGKLQADEEDVF